MLQINFLVWVCHLTISIFGGGQFAIVFRRRAKCEKKELKYRRLMMDEKDWGQFLW